MSSVTDGSVAQPRNLVHSRVVREELLLVHMTGRFMPLVELRVVYSVFRRSLVFTGVPFATRSVL